jgi:microcystin-dependent protein
MADPFLGEIRIFPFSFAPKNWAFCNGQLMPLSQNTALFALLETRYGGNGQTNFALPNLQGRAPMHAGQGPGLSNRPLAESGGSAAHALTESELPAHNHALRGSTADANRRFPAGNVYARTDGPQYGAGPPVPMAEGTVAPTGAGEAHPNMQPYITLNFCIALQGIFPPRD